MTKLVLLTLAILPITACKNDKAPEAADKAAAAKPEAADKAAAAKPEAAKPEAPIELSDTLDLGAAITDPDEKSYAGLTSKAPKGSKAEPGLVGVLVRMGERQAFEVSKAFEPGEHVPKAKQKAQDDTLDKLVKLHIDTPEAILWETASQLGGENNFHFAAEVKVGDAAYKCGNTGYGNFTRAQAEALLKSCQSLAK